MSKCACKYYLNKMHLVCYCLNDGNIITGRDEVLEVPEAAEWHSYHCLECIVSFPVDWDCDFIGVKNYSTHNSHCLYPIHNSP